jgi:hypothetical protein
VYEILLVVALLTHLWNVLRARNLPGAAVTSGA